MATTASPEQEFSIHLFEELDMVRTAHAILVCLAMVIFFPTGAIGMRLFSFPNAHIAHGTWMIVTYFIFLAGMGLGVWMVAVVGQPNHYHPIIGLVVACGLLLQPFTGLVHHLLYKKSGDPNAATYPHVWWGRAIITLGMINGGLGLHFAGNTGGLSVAYGVVAGSIWVLWIVVIYTAHKKSLGR